MWLRWPGADNAAHTLASTPQTALPLPWPCRWGEHLTRTYKLQAPSLVPLGPGVWHLAKDAVWGKTWVNGRCVHSSVGSTNLLD